MLLEKSFLKSLTAKLCALGALLYLLLAHAYSIYRCLNLFQLGPQGLRLGVLGGQWVLLIERLEISINEIGQQGAEKV
jgi:hypothetical protein